MGYLTSDREISRSMASNFRNGSKADVSYLLPELPLPPINIPLSVNLTFLQHTYLVMLRA